MRIAIIATEIPYPPNHGARIDIWNRIVALSRSGVSIHLITWSDRPVAEHQVQQLYSYVDSATIHERIRSPYLALHPKYPSGVISRRLPKKKYGVELDRLRLISPDIVLLDGVEGAILAASLTQDLHIPLVYRSHNVEHQYLWQLFLSEQDLVRKLLFLVNTPRTLMVERSVRNCSNLVCDISYQDQAYWIQDQTITCGKASKVLPYLLHPDKNLAFCSKHDKDIDVLYVGNLYTPNNVFGLKWFANNVAPSLGELSVVVAGVNPKPELCSVLNRSAINIVANPREVVALYSRAHVLINPVWHSGGVNVKMIELLATGKPVVSTSAGARGLSKQLLRYVHIADDAKTFVRDILECVGDGFSPAQQSAVIKEHGWTNVTKFIRDIQIVIDSERSL